MFDLTWQLQALICPKYIANQQTVQRASVLTGVPCGDGGREGNASQETAGLLIMCSGHARQIQVGES